MNNKIKTAAVLGAGAVGSYVIWGLAKKKGIDLCVIADGERKQRLENEGLLINGEIFRPAVKTAREAHGVDLLIVALKYNALSPALDDIEAVTGENTVVMSIMNGVNSEEIIAGRIGEEHMLYSLIKISSEHRDGGVWFNGEATPGIFFGEKGSPEISPRMAAVIDLFDGTPLRLHPTEDIVTAIWDKFAINISNNLPQAVLGCGIGAYRDSSYAFDLYIRLRRETAAVAAAKGITISPEPDAMMKNGTFPKAARYSTLQDLDAKRPTEVDMFAGELCRMGKETGVPTPYSECFYDLIKALEEKNSGLFDYC